MSAINSINVERKAKQLLKVSGETAFPINLENIANYLGVEIRYDDLDDDVSGFLVVDDKKPTAVINENHHPNRQRFTIAHEIGHYCLHVNKDEKDALFVDKKYAVHHRNADSSLGKYQTEREANLFASILLMPKVLVSKAIKEHDIDFFNDADISVLARKIGVSDQALGFRLARLKYEVGQD